MIWSILEDGLQFIARGSCVITQGETFGLFNSLGLMLGWYSIHNNTAAVYFNEDDVLDSKDEKDPNCRGNCCGAMNGILTLCTVFWVGSMFDSE